MSLKILTVADVFDIQGRIIVVPGPLKANFVGPRQLAVRLRLPDGDERRATLLLEHVFLSPAPKEDRWLCVLDGVSKSEVSIGTEVWSDEG
jgi:hypothetical protein